MAWDNSTRHDDLPSDWHKITKRIKRRDGYRCVQCGSTDHLEVDHIERGDNHSEQNLQTLCRLCHQRKTISESIASRARRRRPPEAHPGMTG